MISSLICAIHEFLVSYFWGGKRPGRLLGPSLPLPVRKLEIREVEIVVQGHGEDGRSPDLSELSCLHS